MTAPAPTYTKGPIETSAPRVADGSMEASACTPRLTGTAAGVSIAMAEAQATDGSAVRRMGHGALASESSATMADAFVAATFDANLGLVRNVRSPGPASSSVLTRVMIAAAADAEAPSRRHPSSAASSARVTGEEYPRFSAGG